MQAQRKGTRPAEHDYSQSGLYFVTLYAEQQRCRFSRIVEKASPRPELKPEGRILERWIRRIPIQFPGAQVERYVIMPNHVHLLIALSGDPVSAKISGWQVKGIPQIVSWLKYQATREIRERNPALPGTVFRRSCRSHVIRNEDDALNHRQHIENNPLNWQLDPEYKADDEA